VVNLEELIRDIFSIIHDYHCDESAQLKEEDVANWINQFDEKDRAFFLQEFLHLLKQGIYISKEQAKIKLYDNLLILYKKLGYSDLSRFIKETRFFNIQKEGKSQPELLKILSSLLNEKNGLLLNPNGERLIKNYVYLDDIIATGKTVRKDLNNWLQEKDVDGVIFAEKVKMGAIQCVVSTFCSHTWAESNIHWIFKCNYGSEVFLKFPIFIASYNIENSVHPSSHLNFAYPHYNKEIAESYFSTLTGSYHEDKAFRAIGTPKTEVFYSTPANRERFENIMLSKGIGILEKVKQKNPAHRPLGATNPSNKTLGTGTLFFTWRNISNTCPLIFWWDNPSHGWKGLFPLKNRG